MTVYKIEHNAVITFLVNFNQLSQTHTMEPTPLEYVYPRESGYSQGAQPRYVGVQEQNH